MKFFGIFAVLLLGLVVIGAKSYAQQTTAISVAPAIIDITADPGDSVTREIFVRNGSELSLPISIEERSLLQDDELIYESEKSFSDASDWIEIEGNKTRIFEAGQTEKVFVTVNIPENASPGGHYAQVSVRGLSLEPATLNSTAIVVPELTVTVLITVAGDVETQMSFEAGNIIPYFVRPDQEITVEFTVINDGNIHDLVTPVFVIGDGESVEYHQQLSSKVILPKTKKHFVEKLSIPDNYGFHDAYVEIRFANGEVLTNSVPETTIITRPLFLMFSLAIGTFASLYVFEHRRNIKNAYSVLRYGKNKE